MPAPTITWSVDADGVWSDPANWNLDRVPDRTDDVAIDTVDFHTITSSTKAIAHTLTVGNDDLVVASKTLRVRSTASFADMLTIAGGNLRLDGASTAQGFSQTGGRLSGAGSLTIASANFGDGNSKLKWLQTGAGTTVLTGDSTFNQGNFYLDGGRILENRGVFMASGFMESGENPFGPTLGGGSVLNDAGATFDVAGTFTLDATGASPNASFTNAGTLEVTGGGRGAIVVNFINTGAVLVDSGTLFLATGSSSPSAFTVASGATLNFSAGTFTLGAGTVGGAGTVEVSGGDLVVDGDTTVGALFETGGAISGSGTLTVGSATFGQASPDWSQLGSGRTVLTGNSTFSTDGDQTFTFFLDGGRILENQGVFTMNTAAKIALGTNPSGPPIGGGTIQNDAGATFNVSGTIFAGKGARIINAGTLETSAGTAGSLIEPNITDTGLIEAASGILHLGGAIDGDGVMRVDTGAILEVDKSAAASLGMTFSGTNATLVLGKTANFAATIGGFAGGDTIKLIGRAATAATLGAGDTLAVTNNGAPVMTLQLTGDYSGATFNVFSDGHHGSDITVTLSGAAVGISAHRFIAAAAALGGTSGAAIRLGDVAAFHAPMLARPHAAIA
jgi:hypothetical protein